MNDIKILSNEKVVEIVKSLIKEHTYLKEDGENSGYYCGEIYAYYYDELGEDSIKKISQSENPRDTFYECFDTTDSEWHEEKQVLDEIKDKWDEDEHGEYDQYEDIVREWVLEHIYFNFPYDHYLKQTIAVNIVVDTGNGNYDFTLNNFASYNSRPNEKIEKESSIYWLVKQQGYAKHHLYKAVREQNFSDSKFMKSIYEECINVTTHMNALVFFVKMTLGEYLDYRENPSDITVKANTNCGLVDFWSGAGSILEIELEKAVTIPEKYVQIHVDGARGYGVDNIYGMMSSFWNNNALVV